MSGLNNHLNNVLLYLEDAFFAGDKSAWARLRVSLWLFQSDKRERGCKGFSPVAAGIWLARGLVPAEVLFPAGAVGHWQIRFKVIAGVTKSTPPASFADRRFGLAVHPSADGWLK
jgi:hypothetical protein